MATKVVPPSAATRARPKVLIVDDEPEMLQLIGDVVGAQVRCRLFSAKTIGEARRIVECEQIDVMLTDVQLPDGDGMTLLPALQAKQPGASSVVMTGHASVNGAVQALRAGAIDFLPKPFSADHLVDRLNRALKSQGAKAKVEKRLERLRHAVRKLNVSRRMVSKKVDLLCNDLVGAYGELAKQLDDLRNAEGFRKLLDSAKDLEQLLCHAMDWLLRHCGYCNVAIWLAADDIDFQLGAYMKYTIPGEAALTDAMRDGMLQVVLRENFIHLGDAEAHGALSQKELEFMDGQTVMACNSTYLGEPLAAMVLFRDGKTPFSEQDEAMVKSIGPIFATALAAIIREDEEEESTDSNEGDDTTTRDEDPHSPFADGDDTGEKSNRKSKHKRKKDDADWWKRGEAPPF